MVSEIETFLVPSFLCNILEETLDKLIINNTIGPK